MYNKEVCLDELLHVEVERPPRHGFETILHSCTPVALPQIYRCDRIGFSDEPVQQTVVFGHALQDVSSSKVRALAHAVLKVTQSKMLHTLLLGEVRGGPQRLDRDPRSRV